VSSGRRRSSGENRIPAIDYFTVSANKACIRAFAKQADEFPRAVILLLYKRPILYDPFLRQLQLGFCFVFATLTLSAEPAVVKARHSIQVESEVRSYTLSLPEKFEEGISYGLIFGFHGSRAEVKAWLHEYTRFDSFIGQKKFIIVYPEGPIGWSSDTSGHDLAFFDTMVEKFKKDFPIDASRIYVFGHSNGARFATFLLCARSEVIAAVAAHSGIFPPSRNRLPLPEHKRPLFVIWGENDELSPAASPAVQSSIKDFESAGFPVETLVLPKWGHSWGGQPNQVEEKMLSFFFSHPLEK
jgi:predicted esterase